MLTYWTTNTGEVTSYCFMMNSSATPQLSDNSKGFKDSFYFKKHISATSRKKVLMEILWLVANCGIVQSSPEGAGPKGIRLLSWFVHSRQISTCVWLVMRGVKTAAMFFQRKKISMLGREITVFFVPMMRRHPDFGLKWHIWWETLYNFIWESGCPTNQKYLKCSSLSSGLFPDMKIFDKVCRRLLPFGQWECLLTGNKWVLVRHKQANNSISLKSVLEKLLWNPERKQQYSCQCLEWKLHEWTLTGFQATSHWNCKTYFEIKCLCQKHKTFCFN